MDGIGWKLLSSGLKAASVFFSFVLLVYLVPYVLDHLGLRSYPGPRLASLSDIWLGWNSARGTMVRAVWDAHRVYGPIVRIAPNHISIADASALQIVYGHSAGILKANFYDVFNPFGRATLFTTRSREEHARKRKIVAHTFAQKTVLEFEPIVRRHIHTVIKKWEHMCAAAADGKGGAIGDTSWSSQNGRAIFNTLKWYNFMVFDIVGDLVFRNPFGMTERGTDMALIAKHPDQVMASYGFVGESKFQYDTVNAVDAVIAQNVVLTAIGMFRPFWRPLMLKLPMPWIRAGNEGVAKIAMMAVTAVAHCSQHPASRNDILAKYFDATDDRGEKMHDLELSAEAVGLLIAGTDTTSNSLGALTFYLAKYPTTQAKLQAELDKTLGAPHTLTDDDAVLASYEGIKNLQYLQDVVNEGLRLFSIAGFGLPRIVPEGGLTILGRCFAPGTVVSVPLYGVHRDKAVWGDDADSFNPGRWSRGNRALMTKAFAPFSVGPRACIGRNLASMELLLVVANIFHRFEAKLVSPGQVMEVRDGFLRQPLSSVVSLKRRGTV